MNKLDRLICNYTGSLDIEQDMDLMAKPISLPPHSMVALFLDIEKEFSISLNELVPTLNMFSPKEISERIIQVCSDK